MSIIDFDIRAYLEDQEIPYWDEGSTNVARGWVGIECPFCDDDHNHLGVNTTYKNYSCWRCEEKGSLVHLIQELENVSYSVARDRIDEFQSDIPIIPDTKKKDNLEDRGQLILPEGCGELTGGQWNYLLNRGFDPDELVELWGLKGGPIHGPWRYRIIIPIEMEGRILSWVGLDTSGTKNAKYKAAASEESFISTSELLYGVDYAGDNVLVVEGPADAWRIGPGAISTLGMGVADEKVVELLRLNAKKYYIMFDGEPLATKNAHKLADKLSANNKDVEVLELESGDPGDFSKKEAKELRHELNLGV